MTEPAAAPGVTRRFEDDEFYPPAPARQAPAYGQYAPYAQAPFGFDRVVIPEDEFYATPRPPTEASLFVKAAERPWQFGALLFLVGWAGILLQLGFLRQLVVGAPIFEEFAKFGPPLLVVALLGARSLTARLPWAWLSGGAFGIFEHYSTYSSEPLWMFAERVAFHAGATGLSMVIYTAVERLPSVRSRWVSTVPATVIHWGNNFGALVFAIFSVFLPYVDEVAMLWTLAMTSLTFVLTLVIASKPSKAREAFDGLAGTLLPRVTEPHLVEFERVRAPAHAGAPSASGGPARAPTSSGGAEAAEAPRADRGAGRP